MTKETNIADLQKKSKLPVKQAGGSTVAAFFNQNKDTIAALLPKHVSPDRMMKIALGAIRTTPKLQEATSQSLFGAIVTCAQLGLEPNTPAGHAYLIPFGKGQGKNRTTEVQVIVGYRGLIDLARRSGQIISISAHAVFQEDEFSYEYGLEEHCKHIPAEGDRGEITHFYAVAKLVGGGYAFEVMSRNAVEKIRDGSSNWKTAVKYKTTGRSIWTLHFEEMGRKTTIRKLYKYLPTSIEMARADMLDAKSSVGDSQDNSQVLEGEFTVEMPDQDYTDAGSQDLTVDVNGEEFDPDQHLAKDKFNNDGSFTKRPKRTKTSTKENSDATRSKPIIDAMTKASNMDELSTARELANGPDTGLTEDDISAIDGIYQTLEAKIKNGGEAAPEDGNEPPKNEDGDPGFAEME